MKPMVTLRPHSVRATPRFIELCKEYAQHYMRCAQERIEEYGAAIARQKGFRAITSDHAEVLAASREIARAQVVSEALDVLREALERYYDLNFELWGQVYRQTRIELGLERIEDDPATATMLKFTTTMLKSQNPKFKEDKFIGYINGGNNDHPERQQAQGVQRPERRINPANMA